MPFEPSGWRHGCAECALCFSCAGALARHVAADHRAAADGAAMIAQLLATPPRSTLGPPSPPPRAARRPHAMAAAVWGVLTLVLLATVRPLAAATWTAALLGLLVGCHLLRAWARTQLQSPHPGPDGPASTGR